MKGTEAEGLWHFVRLLEGIALRFRVDSGDPAGKARDGCRKGSQGAEAGTLSRGAWRPKSAQAGPGQQQRPWPQ